MFKSKIYVMYFYVCLLLSDQILRFFIKSSFWTYSRGRKSIFWCGKLKSKYRKIYVRRGNNHKKLFIFKKIKYIIQYEIVYFCNNNEHLFDFIFHNIYFIHFFLLYFSVSNNKLLWGWFPFFPPTHIWMNFKVSDFITLLLDFCQGNAKSFNL